MLVKCKGCGNKNERNDSFKVVVNEKNQYYCSEKEYLEIKEARETKKSVLDIINQIFGYEITNTAIYKELTEISNVHTYKKINSYLIDNKEFLIKTMNKSFQNEYGKIRYFATIIKNNIRDYIPKQEEVHKQLGEITEIKYKPKERKKGLSEYLIETE